MTANQSNKRPSERQVGARIRIQSEKVGAAAELFEAAGFRPIFVDPRPDGATSFWFGKMPDGELLKLSETIPRDFYALKAVIG